MKEKYYLLSTAGSNMGSGNSYTWISETELFKEKNLWMLTSPYCNFYEKVDSKTLLKLKSKIKKSPDVLKREKLEVAQEALWRFHRSNCFGNPWKGYKEELERLEKEVERLKK
jgi:hypothetical protein